MATPSKKGIVNLAEVPEVRTALSNFDNAVQSISEQVAHQEKKLTTILFREMVSAIDPSKLLLQGKGVAKAIADTIGQGKYYCGFLKKIRSGSVSIKLSKDLKASAENEELQAFVSSVENAVETFKEGSKKVAKKHGVTIAFNEQDGFTVSGKVKNAQDLQTINHIPGALTPENVKMLDQFLSDLKTITGKISNAKKSTNHLISADIMASFT